jgi:hypothetical protein
MDGRTIWLPEGCCNEIPELDAGLSGQLQAARDDDVSLQDPGFARVSGWLTVGTVRRGRFRAMRASPFVVLLALAALGTACSSVRTQYDFDPSTDFSAWRTYAWYPSDSPPTGTAGEARDGALSRDIQPDRVTQRVNEAVDEILAQFPPNQ